MIPTGSHTAKISIDGGVLTGEPRKVYGMISGDNERTKASGNPRNSNSMREMRAAFGLPLGIDYIHEWLTYWDSLTYEQRVELRRMNLDELHLSDIPRPKEPKLS